MKNFKFFLVRLIKPKFFCTYKLISNPRLILDIGVANNSYSEFKAIYPNAIYHGLDYVDAGTNFKSGDKFILEDLESENALSGFSEKYDLIVINHVLEHLNNGLYVFSKLCDLLNSGGVLYAEFPSIRTLRHNKSIFSYHFHDDETHKKLYKLEDLCNIAFERGLKVISCGPVSTPLKNLLSLPRAFIALFTRDVAESHLLHLSLKIDHILIRKI